MEEEEDILQEDEEMERRGFVTENMVGEFYKKKNRKSQKSVELFQNLIDKKFSNRKK